MIRDKPEWSAPLHHLDHVSVSGRTSRSSQKQSPCNQRTLSTPALEVLDITLASSSPSIHQMCLDLLHFHHQKQHQTNFLALLFDLNWIFLASSQFHLDIGPNILCLPSKGQSDDRLSLRRQTTGKPRTTLHQNCKAATRTDTKPANTVFRSQSSQFDG